MSYAQRVMYDFFHPLCNFTCDTFVSHRINPLPHRDTFGNICSSWKLKVLRYLEHLFLLNVP